MGIERRQYGIKINCKKEKRRKSEKVFVDGIPHIWVEGYKGTQKI